jgi:thioredoxin-dependent peroxiredoxin
MNLFFQLLNTVYKTDIGSAVPEFILPDQNGHAFNIKDYIGKKNLVIFFYPKDDTPGCTREACYFRDQYEIFKEADAMIIGISGQSVKSHRSFAEKHKLNYTLLSDQKGWVRKMFGAPAHGLIPGRVTYIVDKTGTIIYIFNSMTEATRHVDEALRILLERK